MSGAQSGVSASTVAIGNAIWDMAKTAASAVGDFVKSVAQVGASFDSSMSKVAAISGATGEDFDALREKAMEMGEKTVFSASEAADAMGYMAMAGWKTEDMLGGIEGVMNLAAASGEDLATTSDIVTDALTAFGLTAEDSGHFADVLAAASSNANTNVSMMGETFKYVGALAGTMNYSIEDMASAIGLMANSGIKGSQAGTALRSAITKLTDPTEEAITVMRQLGIMVTETTNAVDQADLDKAFLALEKANDNVTKATLKYNDALEKNGSESSKTQIALLNLEEAQRKAADAQEKYNVVAAGVPTMIDLYNSAITDEAGNLKSFSETIDALRESFSGLTEEEQAQAASTLFGQEAMAGMLAIINAAPADIEKLSGAIAEADGAAEQMANVMTDNLGGAWTLMQSAIESLKITLFDTFSDDAQQMVESFTGVITRLTDAFSDGGFVGAADEFGKIIGELVDAAQVKLDESGGIGSVLSDIIEAVRQLGGAFDENLPNIISSVSSAVSSFFDALGVEMPDVGGIAKSVGNLFATFIEELPERINKVSDGINRFISGFKETAAGDAIGRLAESLGKLFKPFTDAAAKIISDVSENFGDFSEKLGEFAGGAVETLALNLADIVDEFQRWLPLITGVAAAFIVFEIATKIAEGFAALKAAMEGLTIAQAALNIVMNANPFVLIASLIAGVVAALVTLWATNDEFRTACVDAWEAVKTAISDAGGAISAFFTETIPQKIDELKGFFSDIGAAFKEIGSNIVNGIKSGVESAWNALTTFIDGKISSLTQGVKDFFGIHSPSRLMRDEVGKWLPLGIAEGFDSSFDAAENKILGRMDGLSGKMSNYGTIDFSKSALGMHGASVNSTAMLTANAGQSQAPIKLYIDGREIATVMYQPLIDEGKRSGIPLYAR